MAVIRLLSESGVKLEQAIQVDGLSDSKQAKEWEGLTFVITGTLSSMTRREAESRVKELGGNPTSSVTKNTDYLVAGESAGSKLSIAPRLGTPIRDESHFISFLENPSADPIE